MLDPSTTIGQLFGPSCKNIRDQLTRIMALDLPVEVRAGAIRLSARFEAFENQLERLGLDLPMARTTEILNEIASALSSLTQGLPATDKGTVMAETSESSEKRFTLTFSTENDAFQDAHYASEVMRILGEVRGHIATGRFSGTIRDRNGNTIGSFTSKWRKDD